MDGIVILTGGLQYSMKVDSMGLYGEGKFFLVGTGVGLYMPGDKLVRTCVAMMISRLQCDVFCFLGAFSTRA